MFAAASLHRLHDQPGMAADVIREAGLCELDCSAMDEFEKEPLRVINKERGMKLTGLD